MNIYQEHGFADRKAYLNDLAQDYPRDAVFMLADLLGPNEDFDGLVTMLEDGDFSDFSDFEGGE